MITIITIEIIISSTVIGFKRKLLFSTDSLGKSFGTVCLVLHSLLSDSSLLDSFVIGQLVIGQFNKLKSINQ